MSRMFQVVPICPFPIKGFPISAQIRRIVTIIMGQACLGCVPEACWGVPRNVPKQMAQGARNVSNKCMKMDLGPCGLLRGVGAKPPPRPTRTLKHTQKSKFVCKWLLYG